jgi:O-antigen/teichoic acid export membrane protein
MNTPSNRAPEPVARSLFSVGRGTAVLVVSTILLFFFNFVGRVAVAREFSVASWGDFSIGIALTGALSIVALLGLHQAVARMLSYERDPGMRRKVVRWGLGLTVLGGTVASLTIYLLAGPIASLFLSTSGNGAGSVAVLTETFQLLSVTVGFYLMSLFLAAIFQGFEDAVPNAWFNQVINPGLFLVFVLLFIVLHLGYVGALLAYVLANGVAFAAIAVYTWRKVPALLPRAPEPPGPPRGLLNLSVSLWGVSALSFVTAYVDTLILGVFDNRTIVGDYSAAMTLARLLLVGASALTYIFLPVAARLARDRDTDTIRTTYVTATRWILIITVPMFLLFALMPGLSIGAVFGSKYDAGSVALSILVVGSFLSVLVGPANAALAGMGYTRALLVTSLISAVLNVVLSLGLIPTLGMIGASLAWAVARAMFPGSGIVALWRSDRINPFRRILVAPLAVSLAIGVPLFYFLDRMNLPLWTAFPLYGVGVLVFLLSMLVTRSLDPGDLIAARMIENLLGRPMPALRRFMGRFIAREAVGHEVLPPPAT